VPSSAPSWMLSRVFCCVMPSSVFTNSLSLPL
jgi:hypothetical protein